MGLPSASRGAGADKSGLPSGSRGMPTDRTFSHCALAGALTHANKSAISIRRLFISITAFHMSVDLPDARSIVPVRRPGNENPQHENPQPRILNRRLSPVLSCYQAIL